MAETADCQVVFWLCCRRLSSSARPVLSLLMVQMDFLARPGLPLLSAQAVAAQAEFCFSSLSPTDTQTTEQLAPMADLEPMPVAWGL